jgi:hypothetical protein
MKGKGEREKAYTKTGEVSERQAGKTESTAKTEPERKYTRKTR